jgi:uncharacterized protein
MRTIMLGELHALIAESHDLRSLRERIAPCLSIDPGHDLAHCLRVALWTIRLSEEDVEPGDAIAAALCHDIVNAPKNSPARTEASTMSAGVARDILREFSFHEESVTAICDAIRDHSYSRGATPATALGRALQDADRLDALGAIGIFRTISVGVQMGARFFDPDDPWATARPMDDHAYTIDHFFLKLLKLPSTMCTPDGKIEGARRVRIMQDLLNALSTEIGMPRVQETS